MKRSMSVCAVMVAAVAVALVVGVAPLGAQSAANSVTYQDSTGEDPGGFDISQVVVSNNDSGILTFAVTLLNAPSSFSGHNDVELFIDTDNNQSDGAGPNFDGAEMAVQATDGTVNRYTWDGTNFSATGTQPSSLVYSYSGGVLTITVKASDLQLTNFTFYVFTDTDYSSDASPIDFAPDPGHGNYSYQVKISPPAPAPAPKPKPKPKPLPKCKPHHKSTKAHRCHK